ncbi:homoserine O-acetyltransferase [Burkholderia sp. D7]|nr:homoserine O-acetyltransferase [Burkholderia sp. D7]
MNQTDTESTISGIQKHKIERLQLENGAVLTDAITAYLTFGELAPDGRNAILVTHGYTSGPEMVLPGGTTAEGSWCELVGPGKPIDTRRFFVVCPNMLGSSFGSTNGLSINPATGQSYGSRFPDLSLVDIVNAQRKLLEYLGVRHLVAVAGPSYGGFQAFQWAVSHSDFVDGIVAVTCAPSCPGANTAGIVEQLAEDPNWHGGDYYGTAGVQATLERMRVRTLRNFGIDSVLADRFPDQRSRDAQIAHLAGAWARTFDANSMVILMRAAERFDVRADLAKITARVLFVLSSTDQMFPPTIAPQIMNQLRDTGVRATYYEIASRFGHFASGIDAAQWAPRLKAFIDELTCQPTPQPN